MTSDTSRFHGRKVTNFFGRAADLLRAIDELAKQIADIERDIQHFEGLTDGDGPENYQNRSYAVSYRRQVTLPTLRAKLKSAELLYDIIVHDLSFPSDRMLLVTVTHDGADLIKIEIQPDIQSLRRWGRD